MATRRRSQSRSKSRSRSQTRSRSRSMKRAAQRSARMTGGKVKFDYSGLGKSSNYNFKK